MENYEEYYKNIFTKRNINILNKMDDENKRRLEDKIMKIISVK